MHELLKYITQINARQNRQYFEFAQSINDVLFMMYIQFDIDRYQLTASIDNCETKVLDLSVNNMDDYLKLVKYHFEKEMTLEHTRNND